MRHSNQRKPHTTNHMHKRKPTRAPHHKQHSQARKDLDRAKHQALHCLSLACHCTVCLWFDFFSTKTSQLPFHATVNQVFFSSKSSWSSSVRTDPRIRRKDLEDVLCTWSLACCGNIRMRSSKVLVADWFCLSAPSCLLSWLLLFLRGFFGLLSSIRSEALFHLCRAPCRPSTGFALEARCPMFNH